MPDVLYVAVGCLSVGEKVVKGFELGLSLYHSDRRMPDGPILPKQTLSQGDGGLGKSLRFGFLLLFGLHDLQESSQRLGGALGRKDA